MKLENSELLVAAQVLELAGARRKAAWLKYAKAHDLPAQPLSDDMTRWRDEHPISEFVPEALQTIQDVAMQIRAITAASSQDLAKD